MPISKKSDANCIQPEFNIIRYKPICTEVKYTESYRKLKYFSEIKNKLKGRAKTVETTEINKTFER